MVLTAAGMLATDANAQPNLNPLAPVQPATYRYPVGPQAGAWLICVQTFKGDNAQQLAEEMAELLIRDKRYALSAYLCDRGGKERLEEQERVHQQRQQYDEWLNQMKSQGVEPSRRPFRLRTFNNTQEEFAVLVTVPNRPLKDMDDAHDFLVKKVRKLPPPPNKFMSQLNFTKEDPSGKKSDLVSDGFVNPFQFAMVFHNPTIPIEKQQADPEKADEFLKKLNAGESLSVLKCSKPWTLVVKVYQGQTVLEAPQSPSIMTSVGRGLGLIKKEPEILNAQTAQARADGRFAPPTEVRCLRDAPEYMQPSYRRTIRQSHRPELGRHSAVVDRSAIEKLGHWPSARYAQRPAAADEDSEVAVESSVSAFEWQPCANRK